jgi:hypothetical protein|tara:strand:- start:11254 stop:11817 length:564 start_codon:yes stop_codon:yes gene_type:complete
LSVIDRYDPWCHIKTVYRERVSEIMELTDRPRTLHTLTDWVMTHNTGSYNDLTKALINLNAATVLHWRTGGDCSRLSVLVASAVMPEATVQNIHRLRRTLSSIQKYLTEAECILEGALADRLHNTFVERCLSCISELNRQNLKVVSDLKYATNTRRESKKRRREEARLSALGSGTAETLQDASSDDD